MIKAYKDDVTRENPGTPCSLHQTHLKIKEDKKHVRGGGGGGRGVVGGIIFTRVDSTHLRSHCRCCS